MVGGFVFPDQGYQSDPCPECNPPTRVVLFDLETSADIWRSELFNDERLTLERFVESDRFDWRYMTSIALFVEYGGHRRRWLRSDEFTYDKVQRRWIVI